MPTVINNKQTSVRCGMPESLYEIFPPMLSLEIEKFLLRFGGIEEIRVRRNRRASLTVEKKNIMLNCVIDGEQMEQILKKVSGYSLYAHSDTIKKGFVTIDGGIRVGIVGRAALEDERIVGIYDVSSMSFRLPHKAIKIGEAICELLKVIGSSRGILIYSPPGEGKTTLLREVARRLSQGDNAIRVAVIDTRDELCYSLDAPTLCLDIMTGYPRPLGIEIATRTMNSQLIICDEVGDVAEADAIISAQNCGVPFLASAHADSIDALLCRTAIRKLHEARIFEYYVGIQRSATQKWEFEYDIIHREEADEYY